MNQRLPISPVRSLRAAEGSDTVAHLSHSYQLRKLFDRLRLPIHALLLTSLLHVILAYWGQVPVAQAASCSGSGITGAIFRDYNANGVQDIAAAGSGGITEPGIGGIVVTAYDANGTVAACESTTNGAYGIDPAGAYPVRLEFTLPADGSLNFLKPGAAGSNGRTTVSFVSGPTTNLNAGFSAPADFCGAAPSPTLATSCFVFGEQVDPVNGANRDKSVMFTFPYNAGSATPANETAVSSPAPAQLASAKQLGSVWGLAWNPQTQTIYAAAFMRRHAGFGPSGPGAIYQITAGGAVSLYHTIGALAGADPHPAPGQICLSPGHNANNTNNNCWLNDTNSFDQVGKIGFGDLDIAEDFSTLYTVNLAEKTLLSIPVANPSGATTTALPTPANCATVDLRPFGLGVKDGKVYVGMVCSAESTQSRANLRAYVYAFANGAFAATPTLEIDLSTYRTSGNIQWRNWLNRTSFTPSDPDESSGKWAQPWLTDIAFDGNDMVLALRDRDADLFGTVAGGPDPADAKNYSAIARGDILRACATGNGGWQLENKGACGGVTTAGATGHPEGPGGGEYYYQDEQIAQPHAETSVGALLQVPGLPDVVSTIFNPVELAGAVSDAGVKWYNNRTGATSRGYRIYDGSDDPSFFSKANGLGDLEALCPAAPLEIGNRVWRDDDGDGVQDPGEPGLDGVTVELYRNGVLVGTTTTTNGGQYLFNDSNVTLNGAGGIATGLCGPNGASVYEVRIPNTTGGSQQPPLAGLTLTQANNGGATNGDLRDSNGTLIGTGAVYAIPCSDLSAPGFNNHTYDFGFTPAQTHSLGNYIWIDANNDGLVTVGEVAVPNGIVVELLTAAGAPTGQTTQTTNGFYLFSGLPAGSYRVRVAASNFQVGGLLANYTSSTGAGQEANPDSNGDQNDNGLDSGVPASDGILSAVITLGSDEPTGESPTANGTPGDDGAGTADANSNLTVDFGVVPPPLPVELVAIGNVVFRDLNNNGRFESGEIGINGVQVALFAAGVDPLSSAPIATTTTTGGGFYLFDNLPPGQYFVYVLAGNFQGTGALASYLSSTGNGTSDSSDDNLDENGIDGPDLATNGVRSIVYDLQPNSEPTGETGAGAYGGVLDDNNVNLTADFGVYLPLSLGNRVWLDDGAGGGNANNGVMDGTEVGIANVVVRLLDGAGNPVMNANGQPLVATTDAQGYYFFSNLLPGAYVVLVDAANFAVGGPLQELSSSDPTEGVPDSDGDLNDNGINVANPATAGIRSGIVNLAYNTEPITETDLGPVGAVQAPNTNNLTIDFGFHRIPTDLEEGQEPTRARSLYLPVVIQ